MNINYFTFAIEWCVHTEIESDSKELQRWNIFLPFFSGEYYDASQWDIVCVCFESFSRNLIQEFNRVIYSNDLIIHRVDEVSLKTQQIGQKGNCDCNNLDLYISIQSIEILHRGKKPMNYIFFFRIRMVLVDFRFVFLLFLSFC